jgi:hypothetical protein
MLLEEPGFKVVKDFNIYYRKWLPSAGAKADLPGHSGRYNNMVNFFVPKEYAIYARGYVLEGMPPFQHNGQITGTQPPYTHSCSHHDGKWRPGRRPRRVLYEYIGHKDKTLKLYEGLLHEILNEPEYFSSGVRHGKFAGHPTLDNHEPNNSLRIII